MALPAEGTIKYTADDSKRAIKIKPRKLPAIYSNLYVLIREVQ